MLNFTRITLAILGVSAVAIGTMIFVSGPEFTANAFSVLYETAFGKVGYSEGLGHVNVDTEMRFYSVFWVAYGCILLWLAKNMEHNAIWVFVALGLFFMGGVGRVASFASFGAPDPLFVVLMLVEIVGPTLVALTYSIGLRAKT